MQAILPGRPGLSLQAVASGIWEGQLVIAYVSGTALVILNGPQSILQTIYHDEDHTGDLVGVVYQSSTGKIAVASASQVYIYGLREEIKGTLRWTRELSLVPSSQDERIRTLSWGSDEELLVGSNDLSLYTTSLPSRPGSPLEGPLFSTTARKPTWTKSLASPVSHALFSPSASLIATSSVQSCLVKIWRRLSYEAPQFDYAYLGHPSTVTHIEWRISDDATSREDEVLYTICADGKFRVWRACEPNNTDILSLHAELDLNAAIQPRDAALAMTNTTRYAFTLTSEALEEAVKQMMAGKEKGQDKHAIEYAREIASRKSDIVVVMDDQGHMSAWGLENIGCKKRHSDSGMAVPFHITHTEGFSLGFKSVDSDVHKNARFVPFTLPSGKGDLCVLIHHFDGRIQWWQGQIQAILDPSNKKDRIRNRVSWTGHSDAVKKVIRTASGSTLISRTNNNEGIIWTRSGRGDNSGLRIKSIVSLQEHIHRTVILQDGNFFVLLHHETIGLWDGRSSTATEVGRCSYSLKGKPLCLLVLPEAEGGPGTIHLATVSSEMQGIVWELNLPQDSYFANPNRGPSISQFCTFQIDDIADLMYVLPVDPAGSPPVRSGFLDTFAQDVAMAYTSTGLLRTWAVRVNVDKRSVNWLTTGTIETGVTSPSLGSATSIRRAALVSQDGSTLTIWDSRSGRLDLEKTFTGETIQDLDWVSTPDGQSVLAVGFSHRVLVYTQLRYDYVNERPAWARIKDIRIDQLTPHPIGDSVWLGNGSLVIGAGNQLFVATNTIDFERDLAPEVQSSIPHQRAHDMYELVRRMNGPLPVYHPQFISQCILGGKIEVVHRVLVDLYKTLKFYTEGDELDPLLGFDLDGFIGESSHARPSTNSRSYGSHDADEEATSVTEELAESLINLLSQKAIAQLTSAEQLSLADMVSCVGTLEKHRRSIDDNAARFLLFWRESIVRSHQSINGTPKKQPSAAISWREMVWAYHSSSQDILIDLITRQHKGRLEWPHARDAGVFMWLSDREALLAQFEAIARNAYTSSDPKNPVDCSLYYLALRKKAVLLGLWRMATWSREQAATMRLLRNDFSDPRWKTAALKNAYALMGKRRFEYAAAFFLLADDLSSAVSVLSNQLGDVQLAVAVARVYGGDSCPALQKLLTTKVLPLAASEGNRWQSTWAYWLLGQRSHAVRALVSPLQDLLPDAASITASNDSSPSESRQAKSFLNDDPALVVLYAQLREKSLQTLKGALMISGPEEWGFVTKTASLLRRMGCEILALDLVRNWDFLLPMPPAPRTQTSDVARSTTKVGSEVPIDADESGEAQESVGDLASTRDVPHRNRTSIDDAESAGAADFDPRKLLRRRSSLVVADMPTSPSARMNGTFAHRARDGGAPATPGPKVVSMLDDYGFGGGDTITPSREAEAKKEERNGTVDEKAETKKDEDEKKEKEQEKKKPPPTTFKEPDANSLLDSFGF